jgi:hypothetical protein
MIQKVDVIVPGVAFHFPSLPIHSCRLFKVTRKGKYRSDDFSLQDS